jgi:hypothetical protein
MSFMKKTLYFSLPHCTEEEWGKPNTFYETEPQFDRHSKFHNINISWSLLYYPGTRVNDKDVHEGDFGKKNLSLYLKVHNSTKCMLSKEFPRHKCKRLPPNWECQLKSISCGVVERGVDLRIHDSPELFGCKTINNAEELHMNATNTDRGWKNFVSYEEVLACTNTTTGILTVAVTITRDVHQCSACGLKEEQKLLKRCKCHKAYYCTKKCQRKHWKIHQKTHQKELKQQQEDVNTHQKELQQLEEDVNTTRCPECNGSVCDNTMNIVRLLCCGRGIHRKCLTSLFGKKRERDHNPSSINQVINLKPHFCPFCEEIYPEEGTSKQFECIARWCEIPRKAWACSMMGEYWFTQLQNAEVLQSHEEHMIRQQIWFWYLNGAYLGNSTAMSNVGSVYGNVGKRDEAYKWWVRSAAFGNQTAIKCLNVIDKTTFHDYGTKSLWHNGEAGQFTGEMKGGIASGEGTWISKLGAVYVGEFKDDKFHGYGTFTFLRTGKYIGEWKANKQHGKGKLWYEGILSSGEFKDGKLSKGVKSGGGKKVMVV